MPAQIAMPQQTDTMTEGTVVKWLKKEGDKIRMGDVIAEIETDKAVMEMEAPEDGTLAAIVVQSGQKVPVSAPIAWLARGSEKVEDVKKQASAAPKPASAPKPAAAPPPAPRPATGMPVVQATAPASAKSPATAPKKPP